MRPQEGAISARYLHSAGDNDADLEALAQRLAEFMQPMRATSRYALQTFLDAVNRDMRGVSLTLHAPGRKGDPPEAQLEIDPRD